MVFAILILVPKGNVYNQGIGLMEVLWNLMEAIIDSHIKKSVTFHYFLHRFCANISPRMNVKY